MKQTIVSIFIIITMVGCTTPKKNAPKLEATPQKAEPMLASAYCRSVAIDYLNSSVNYMMHLATVTDAKKTRVEKARSMTKVALEYIMGNIGPDELDAQYKPLLSDFDNLQATSTPKVEEYHPNSSSLDSECSKAFNHKYKSHMERVRLHVNDTSNLFNRCYSALNEVEGSWERIISSGLQSAADPELKKAFLKSLSDEAKSIESLSDEARKECMSYYDRITAFNKGE